jgi:hypothetical protein
LNKKYQGRNVIHFLSPYGKKFVEFIKNFEWLPLEKSFNHAKSPLKNNTKIFQHSAECENIVLYEN